MLNISVQVWVYSTWWYPITILKKNTIVNKFLINSSIHCTCSFGKHTSGLFAFPYLNFWDCSESRRDPLLASSALESFFLEDCSETCQMLQRPFISPPVFKGTLSIVQSCLNIHHFHQPFYSYSWTSLFSRSLVIIHKRVLFAQ